MKARFHKRTILNFLALFRQAERSVHYALSCPSQWPQFLSFYDERRRDQIAKAMESLRQSGADQGIAPARKELERSDLLDFLSACRNLAVNSFKRSWTFSQREAAYFYKTLQRLLELLQRPQRPPTDEFIELRLDCCQAGGIIRHRLLGVRETKDVDKIEHFFQNEWGKHFTFQELGLEAGETDPVPVHTV